MAQTRALIQIARRQSVGGALKFAFHQKMSRWPIHLSGNSTPQQNQCRLTSQLERLNSLIFLRSLRSFAAILICDLSFTRIGFSLPQVLWLKAISLSCCMPTSRL